MPVGKELGSYEGTFTSIRVCEINGEEQIVEGSYSGKVSGQLSGTGSGTTTFSGPNERGILSDLGVAYLDSGDVVSYKGQGVYWSTSQGIWETRAAFVIGDQVMVGEGQLTMADGVVSSSGKLFELI